MNQEMNDENDDYLLVSKIDDSVSKMDNVKELKTNDKEFFESSDHSRMNHSNESQSVFDNINKFNESNELNRNGNSGNNLLENVNNLLEPNLSAPTSGKSFNNSNGDVDVPSSLSAKGYLNLRKSPTLPTPPASFALFQGKARLVTNSSPFDSQIQDTSFNQTTINTNISVLR
jgi:hypothetical protein